MENFEMKTKSIILVMFVTLITCGHTWAQYDLPFRSFKSFNNDTIQYLDYNFLIRSEQYAGEKLSKMISDLNMPILYVSETIEFGHNNDIRNVIEIVLYVKKFIGSSYDNCYVSITPANPIPFRDYMKISKRIDYDDGSRIAIWTSELYDFLKDIEIKSVTANSYLIKERRELLEMHTKEAREQVKEIIESEKAKWRKIIQAEKQELNK